MGGDHKCPVCEATFTRPQHVARHMRSRASAVSAPLHRLPLFQTQGIDLTNANTVETSLPGGASLCFVLLQSPNSVLSVTSYQDTLTNVTQTKNRCPLRVLVKKVLFRLHGPLPQNRSVTSVFRQTLLAMVPILVVCPFPLFPLFFYY